MNISNKLLILADAAKYDASCSSSGGKRKTPKGGVGNSEGVGICHSYTPDGRCISLLKILLTNYCIYDCLYCVNRVSSDTPRARFSVEEVVQLTLDFYRRNYIEGLFLSSGIIRNSDYTLEQLVQVAKTLRTIHGFGGYIHLKTIPNASQELIAEAGKFADRLSINIELPTQADLDQLAPAKSHTIIEKSMKIIKTFKDQSNADKDTPVRNISRAKKIDFAPAGQSTQIIVGATSSSDSLIMGTAQNLYDKYKLRRVYYSAFSPIPFSAPGVPSSAAPLLREHRLYQADWLFRLYGFSHAELFASADDNLNLEVDPKLGWALKNRHLFPVDVNRAPRGLLLRVPGFGTKTVDKIIKSRRFCSIKIADIARLRSVFSKAKFFITTSDHNPALKDLDSISLEQRIIKPPNRQLSLFDPAHLLYVSSSKL